MTVFLAHAPPDREAVEGLEKFLERRGQFVELDDGQTALHPVLASDVVVLLLSKDFVSAPGRLRLEQRALDAWADGRLMVVKLDNAIAPVGLRDLPALDAGEAVQREARWQELANAIDGKLRQSLASPPQLARKRGPGVAIAVCALVLILATPVALMLRSALLAAAYTTTVSGGGDPSDLRVVVERAADVLGIAEDQVLLLVGGAIASVGVGLAIVLIWLAIALLRVVLTSTWRRTAKAGETLQASPPAQTDAVFVSYARANQSLVVPVIEAAQREGRRFWLDRKGVVAGDGWAGEIVRAIRGAAGVMVMCSRAAFESDHVKREVYLADRYRKKLVPVFIENTQPPEDFEYFFAGVQSLNLFDTPEAERPQEVLRALGAPS